MIARVVDYGGLFHDDVLPGHEFAPYDHRRFRPGEWVEGRARAMERMRPIAERHGLSMLQLACAWDLAQPAVRCVAPTLIQESGRGRAADRGQARRAGGARYARSVSAREELEAIRAIGENRGCMASEGREPRTRGAAVADRWGVDEELEAVAERWESIPSGICSSESHARSPEGRR